jgi:DNA-directed RNA polymerase subunit RPC12/RpoP
MQQAKPSDNRLTLECPSCHARLRASRELVGRSCPCPRCRHRIVVRMVLPSDADIALVDDEAPKTPVPPTRRSYN